MQSVHWIQISLLSFFFKQLCLQGFIFHTLVFFQRASKYKTKKFTTFKRIKPILFELKYESIRPFYISKVYDWILMILCFLSLKTFHYFIILEFNSSLFINYFQIYYLKDFLYFNIKNGRILNSLKRIMQQRSKSSFFSFLIVTQSIASSFKKLF